MARTTRRHLLGALGAGALATAGSGLLLPSSAHAGLPAGVTSLAGCDPNPATPKRQLRAMWIASVVNIDWPSRTGLPVAQQKAEYLRLLDEAQAYRLNAVFVQVRPTADAFWPSPHEPWSMWLTGTQGKDPGYDPLDFLVKEAHKRNLEFHAWFNPYRVSMPASLGHAGVDVNKLPADHPARRNPDWVVPYPVDHPSGRLYYNPGIPEVRDFAQNAIMHAVENYDIDAVHFDDYFYPYPAAGQDFGDHDTYAQHGAGFDNIHDWRRNNTNLLIQQLGERIHAAKPWVKFGISPFGIWRNRGTDPLGSETNGLQSYDAIYADSRKWVKEEWIDYMNPQVYWNIGFTVADYAKLTPWWADVVAGTDVHLYIGQAAYKVGSGGAWNDPAELSKHLTFNRDYPEVDGDVYFSAVQLRANRLGSTSRLVSEQYSRPALIPVHAARGGAAPAPPVITAMRRSDDGVELDINPTAGSAPAAYAVYRFPGRSVPDCAYADARYLVGTVRADGAAESYEDKTAEFGAVYTYAATALDRLHHESHPSPPRTT